MSDDFDDILSQAETVRPKRRRTGAPLWVKAWFIGLSVSVVLALLLAVSTSVRSSNNAATIQSNQGVTDELTKNVLSLHEEAEADRVAVAEMRRGVAAVVDNQRDAFGLIDGNAERVAKLQAFTEDAVIGLKGISDSHTEAISALHRINAQQDKTIGGIQGNQRTVGKAINEILAVQASQLEAMKRLAERVGK